MKSSRFFVVVIIAISAMIFNACTPQRKLVYLQGQQSILAKDTTSFTMLLSAGDILQIELNTMNPDAFPGIGTTSERMVITDNRSPYEKGFIMDKEGFVQLPYVGRLHLAGLTIRAAHDTVVESFKKFLDEPDITLKKLSFKVSVLGEVAHPGLYYIPNEQLTLIEAIALAGDLTNFSDRRAIKIIRKMPDGSSFEIPVDFTQKTAYTGISKFIYPDDIIYVPPTKNKAFTAISPAAAVFTSVLTTLVLIGTLYIRIK
jgi:polysaccharide export outer membrane protein